MKVSTRFILDNITGALGVLGALSLEGIIEQSQPIAHQPIRGLYFLLDGEEVVYVGQSIDCESRIRQHFRDGTKKFDAFTVIPCVGVSNEELSDAEAICILTHNPRYNLNLPKNRHYARRYVFAKDGYDAWAIKRAIKLNDVETRTIAGVEYINIYDLTDALQSQPRGGRKSGR